MLTFIIGRRLDLSGLPSITPLFYLFNLARVLGHTIPLFSIFKICLVVRNSTNTQDAPDIYTQSPKDQALLSTGDIPRPLWSRTPSVSASMNSSKNMGSFHCWLGEGLGLGPQLWLWLWRRQFTIPKDAANQIWAQARTNHGSHSSLRKWQHPEASQRGYMGKAWRLQPGGDTRIGSWDLCRNSGVIPPLSSLAMLQLVLVGLPSRPRDKVPQCRMHYLVPED